MEGKAELQDHDQKTCCGRCPPPCFPSSPSPSLAPASWKKQRDFGGGWIGLHQAAQTDHLVGCGPVVPCLREHAWSYGVPQPQGNDPILT